jgi:hypothetical protein
MNKNNFSKMRSTHTGVRKQQDIKDKPAQGHAPWLEWHSKYRTALTKEQNTTVFSSFSLSGWLHESNKVIMSYYESSSELYTLEFLVQKDKIMWIMSKHTQISQAPFSINLIPYLWEPCWYNIVWRQNSIKSSLSWELLTFLYFAASSSPIWPEWHSPIT